MKTMVAGFAFHDENVLLVCKETPEWQHGLWNGVGGKADDHETPVHAMVREFREEVGVETKQEEWRHFATEMGRDYVVHFYWSRIDWRGRVHSIPIYNDAGEHLMFHDVGTRLSGIPVVGNLHWLIPLALDWRRPAHPVLFQTQDDIRERASW